MTADAAHPHGPDRISIRELRQRFSELIYVEVCHDGKERLSLARPADADVLALLDAVEAAHDHDQLIRALGSSPIVITLADLDEARGTLRDALARFSFDGEQA